MSPDEARRLLMRLDGDIRHAAAADLTRAEAAALVLRAHGAPDRFIGATLATAPYRIPGLLDAARRKLLAWHRQKAKEALLCCENRPMREPATFEDPNGEVKEVEQRQVAEDSSLRIHPDLKPSVDLLIAPTREALSVLLD